jgi:ubiquinone/menaquinone biosynthesis C-methylase UbiE
MAKLGPASEILKENFISLGAAEDNDTETPEERFSELEQSLKENQVTLSSDLVILEVGCGSGVFLNHLHNNGHNAIGVEARPRGIIENVVAARIEALPFRDASFDVILSSVVFDDGAYNHSHPMMLKEMARVLRPGGTYVSRGDEIQARPKRFGFSLVKRLGSQMIPVKVYTKAQ